MMLLQNGHLPQMNQLVSAAFDLCWFSITASIANEDIQADEKLPLFTRWLEVVPE